MPDFPDVPTFAESGYPEFVGVSGKPIENGHGNAALSFPITGRVY
jgi:hypothetical protein